jgi:hypothetical protein
MEGGYIMARPKKVIKALKQEERPFFQCIWKTRIIHNDDIKTYYPDISEKRLRLMYKSNFLVRKGNYTILGDKGREYLKNTLKMKFEYTSKKTAYKHDLILNRTYLKLPKYQQDSWKTENELRYDLTSQKAYKDMCNHPRWGNPNDPKVSRKFIPDAAVWSEKKGQYIILEAITRNYSQTDIDQKCETANQFYNGEIYLLKP